MDKLTVKQKEFLKELREILVKYNASILWDYRGCGDSFYLDDYLFVTMDGQKRDIQFLTNCIMIDDIDWLLDEESE